MKKYDITPIDKNIFFRVDAREKSGRQHYNNGVNGKAVVGVPHWFHRQPTC